MPSEKEKRYLAAKEKLQADITQLVNDFDKEHGIERTREERGHLYQSWDSFKSEIILPMLIKLGKEE